jgi:6-pyruvoyltetrahydropterin/6-carboxytetrahydropterin synthase
MGNKKYEIGIEGMFESAHYLYDYHGPGKNEALHGHTYEVELYITSQELIHGISVDFMDVHQDFDKLVTGLDHTCLNAHDPFDKLNPTAENIAEYFFNQLYDKIPENAKISKVTVWEGPKNQATFYPGSDSI